MDAAKANGSELRIAAVAGVSSAPMESSSDEAKEAEGKRGGGKEELGGERRITGVVLEGGEEIPCDRVSVFFVCSG